MYMDRISQYDGASNYERWAVGHLCAYFCFANPPYQVLSYLTFERKDLSVVVVVEL